MRHMVGRERDIACRAELNTRLTENGTQVSQARKHRAERLRSLGLALAGTPAEDQPTVAVDTEPIQYAARLGYVLTSRQNHLAQIVRQRLGGDDRGKQRNHRLRQTRPKSIRIAVGAQHRMRGRYAAARRRQLPALAYLLQCGGGAVAVDAG